MSKITTDSTIMNQNDDILSCPLCHKNFDEDQIFPRILPSCGHTICEQCIQRHLIQSQQTFRCPEDGEIVFCSRTNVEQFVKNISIVQAVHKQQQHLQHHHNHHHQQYQQQQLYKSNGRYADSEEETAKRPTVYPEVMLDVMNLKKHLNHSSEQEEQRMSPLIQTTQVVTLVCQLHHKIMDIGCISCQEKICSHCAIFGDHKNHVVVPEDEIKQKNQDGMDNMKVIQESIVRTKEGFFKTMEDNFEFNICKRIQEKKQMFQTASHHKYQEFQKMLVHAEQRSSEQIDKFFSEIEEKFRQFKNHNFSETYDKIYSFNKLVDETELQSQALSDKAELNFDFYLNFDKLIATAKDIELEFSNLLEFPLKLVNNYLNKLSINFADQVISTAFSNAMNLVFNQPESDVIQQSIQHLTIANQREILMNTAFDKHLLEKLSQEEISQILNSDVPLTPSQAFFTSQSEIASKQKYSIVPAQLNPLQPPLLPQRKTSGSEDSRKSLRTSYQQKGTQKSMRESRIEAKFGNINSMISDLQQQHHQIRQKSIPQQLNSRRDSSVGSSKDKMLLSHIETKEEFLRNTNFNGSFFQSVIVPDPVISVSQQTGQTIMQSFNGTKSLLEQLPAVRSSTTEQNYALGYSSNLSGSRTQRGEISSISNNSSAVTPSKESSPFTISPRPSTKNLTKQPKQSVNYSTLSARFNQTSPLQTRTARKTPPRSNSPISTSQISSKSSTSSYLKQYDDLSLSQPRIRQAGVVTGEPDILQSHLLHSKQNNNGLKHSSSQKTNSLKFFKQATYFNAQQQNLKQPAVIVDKSITQSNSAAHNSSQIRKSLQAVNFKKKSEKFQESISRLRMHEFIDVLELVNEDINDAEAEELANELSRSHSNIESVKLVKNKIGNIGLKAILEGLVLGGHRVHTLNLTSNACTEYCFFDLLKYLELNPNLKNIYLLNNSIQPNRNKELHKSLMSVCNLHI